MPVKLPPWQPHRRRRVVEGTPARKAPPAADDQELDRLAGRVSALPDEIQLVPAEMISTHLYEDGDSRDAAVGEQGGWSPDALEDAIGRAISLTTASPSFDTQRTLGQLAFVLGSYSLELLTREPDTEKRLSLAQDLRAAFENLDAATRDVANTAAVQLVTNTNHKQNAVAARLGLSATRLSQISSQQFVHAGIASEGGEPPDGDLDLRLSPREQLLAGLAVLFVLEQQITIVDERTWARRLQRLRSRYRQLLSERHEMLGELPLPDGLIEAADLRAHLDAMENPGRFCALMVDVCATDPLSSLRAQPLTLGPAVPHGLEIVRLHALDALFEGVQGISMSDLSLVHGGLVGRDPASVRWTAIGAAAVPKARDRNRWPHREIGDVATGDGAPMNELSWQERAKQATRQPEVEAELAFLTGGSLAITAAGLAGGIALLALALAPDRELSVPDNPVRSRTQAVAVPLPMAEFESAKLTTLILLLRRQGDICVQQAERHVSWTKQQLDLTKKEFSRQAGAGKRDPRSTRVELELRIHVLSAFLNSVS